MKLKPYQCDKKCGKSFNSIVEKRDHVCGKPRRISEDLSDVPELEMTERQVIPAQWYNALATPGEMSLEDVMGNYSS